MLKLMKIDLQTRRYLFLSQALGIFLLMMIVALWIPVKLYAQAAEQPAVQSRTVQNASAGVIAENTVTENNPDSEFWDAMIKWAKNNWKWLVPTLIALASVLVTIIFGVLHRKDSKKRDRERNEADDRRHQELIDALIGRTAEEYDKSPTENRETLENIKTTPQYQQASEIQKSFIYIHILQMEGKVQEARDEWRSVAQRIEKTSEPQSLKWVSLARFNAGYLSGKLEEYEGALRDYNEAIRLDPKNVEAYHNRGLIKSDLGRTAEALEDYNEAICLNPKSFATYYNRGNIKRDLGHYEEALKDYDDAIRLNPKFIEAYSDRAGIKSILGRKEEAWQDLNEAICLNPQFSRAYYNRGNIKRDLGHYEEALKDYDDEIRLNPESAEAYSNKGHIKSILGRKEEALQDLGEVIRLNPKSSVAYYNRGNIKRDLGYYEEALKDYDEAIHLNPKFVEAYYNRGQVKSILDRTEEALQDYDKGISLHPEEHSEAYRAAAYYNRGVVNGVLDRKEEALLDYDEAIRLNPKFAEAHYNRGLVKSILGRTKEGLTDWHKALQLAKSVGKKDLADEIKQTILATGSGANPSSISLKHPQVGSGEVEYDRGTDIGTD